MVLLKRTAWGVLLIGGLLAFNWWATAMQQAINARPDLQDHFFYRQFAIYYPIFLEIGRWITLAVSLNLINGLAGQFSLGHAAFMAVGGYAAASVTVFLGFGPLHLPGDPSKAPLMWQSLFAASLVVGGLAAALLGFLVGLPSLRLRGDYLAIVTLGFGEMVVYVINHIKPVGGSQGFNGLPLLTNYFWMYLVAALTIIAVRNIAVSAHGRALKAIREDEVAAEAMGVPLTRYKVTAFVIGAFFAGMAGGLFAHQQGSIEPTAASFVPSIQIVTMVVLGGVGSITGSVLAAILLTLIPELLRSFAPALGRMVPALANLGPLVEQYQMVIYSLLLIVLMLWRPQGLFGDREFSLRGLRDRLPQRHRGHGAQNG